MEFPSFTWVNSYVIGVCIAVNQWVSSIWRRRIRSFSANF
jgi:hypothetical protein